MRRFESFRPSQFPIKSLAIKAFFLAPERRRGLLQSPAANAGDEGMGSITDTVRRKGLGRSGTCK